MLFLKQLLLLNYYFGLTHVNLVKTF